MQNTIDAIKIAKEHNVDEIVSKLELLEKLRIELNELEIGVVYSVAYFID